MNEQVSMRNQLQQPQLMNLNQNMMSQMNSQPQMVPMNRGYAMWQQPPQFQNPIASPSAMKPPLPAFKKSLGPRSNWKGKKVNNLNDKRRHEQQKSLMIGSGSSGIIGGVNIVGGGGSVANMHFNSYQPPTLNELQHQNRLKTRKFFPKKKFNKNNNMNMNMGGNNKNYSSNRSAPFAPRNTTSFIIRAKRSGGIASLVSPSPMTPAVLPTPILSPSREVLVDMAKEEWGVDGYGSMKGLIRLRSPSHDIEAHEYDEEDEGGSSESDVEEHVEVERRLDHDLSRFEMIYNPNDVGGAEYHNVLENHVEDQDAHIAQLEEENLILKERLFLMEREVEVLRRRVQVLETRENRGDVINDEVVENDFDNESRSRDEEVHSMEDNNEEFNTESKITGEPFVYDFGKEVENSDDGINETDMGDNVTDEVKEENDNKFIREGDARENKEVQKEIGENNRDENKELKENNEGITETHNRGNINNLEGNRAQEDEEVVKGTEEHNDGENKCMDVEVKEGDIADKRDVNNDDENMCMDVEVKEEDIADKSDVNNFEVKEGNMNKFVDGNRAEEEQVLRRMEVNNDEENKCLDVEVKEEDNADYESNKHVAKGDVSLKEI